jgi:hypothetical protein
MRWLVTGICLGGILIFSFLLVEKIVETVGDDQLPEVEEFREATDDWEAVDRGWLEPEPEGDAEAFVEWINHKHFYDGPKIFGCLFARLPPLPEPEILYKWDQVKREYVPK